MPHATTHAFDHKLFRVPPGKKPHLSRRSTRSTAGVDKTLAVDSMLEDKSVLASAQELLWASRERAMLIILQALDAAGKDGTIKHVMSGVNPQGVDVYSFRAPSEEERKHHFLWRPVRFLPARGHIAIFNRSYYEETLVVRVHPEFLDDQWLSPQQRKLAQKKSRRLWLERYEEIKGFEQLVIDSGVEILKFFLHISFEEQGKRLMERLSNPNKYWKFSEADLAERELWSDYHRAYEEMITETGTSQAPWYVIPADRKWFARAVVADIIGARITALNLGFPSVSKARKNELKRIRKKLLAGH